MLCLISERRLVSLHGLRGHGQLYRVSSISTHVLVKAQSPRSPQEGDDESVASVGPPPLKAIPLSTASRLFGHLSQLRPSLVTAHYTPCDSADPSRLAPPLPLLCRTSVACAMTARTAIRLLQGRAMSHRQVTSLVTRCCTANDLVPHKKALKHYR
jgi:hypothetical protein